MQASTILELLFSFCFVSLSIPAIIRITKNRNWPNKTEKNKADQKIIPILGDLGIYLGFWILVFFFGSHINEADSILPLWGSSWLLFITNLWDDIYGSSPMFKLFNQIIAGSICYFGGLKIVGFYGIMNIWEVGEPLQYILTVLTIVTIINAFVLIDRIDRLAGNLFLQASIIFSILFWQAGLEGWFLISIIGIGTMLGFLLHNFKSTRIFMGSSGSKFLGLLLAVFLIQFLNASHTLGGDYSMIVVL